ncbi:MAG: Crp/Fnr family transcriptional regulator [Pseudomonadota bacterium]
MTPDDLEFLRSTEWLSSFSKTTSEEILKRCSIVEYTHGQRVHKKGDKSDGLQGVISGGIRYTAVTASGYETSFAVVISGDWAGNLSSIADFGKSHDGFAIGALRIALLSSADIEDLKHCCDDFYPILINNLCLSMRDAFEEIDMILSTTPEQRLAWRLCDFCVHAAGENAVLFNQQDLAALVGVSRQSINKILQKWAQQDLIQIEYGKLNILDIERLRAIVRL